MECAKKELQEEAGVGPELAERIKSVDAITYASILSDTVKIEGEFIFDIKLPTDFEPINQDKEVECFYLMNIDQVRHTNQIILCDRSINKLNILR